MPYTDRGDTGVSSVCGAMRAFPKISLEQAKKNRQFGAAAFKAARSDCVPPMFVLSVTASSDTE
jgi:hypothetical protein